MIITILFLIVVFIIVFLHIRNRLEETTIFTDIRFIDLEKYLYILKYRGIADESILQNAGFFFESFFKDGILIGIVKYKEFGESGFYFLIKKDSDKREDLFLKKIEELNLKYFIWEGRAIYSKYYVVDIKYSVEYFKELVRLFWIDTPEEDLYFDLNFRGSMSKEMTVNIDNADKEIIEKKQINFDIPIIRKKYFLYLMKGKTTKP
jgi:hypothetical protein